MPTKVGDQDKNKGEFVFNEPAISLHFYNRQLLKN